MSDTTWKSKVGETIARTRAELAQLVRATAFRLQQSAQLRAPVDTGFLRNSIATVFESDLSAIIFVGASYGVYVERGTVKMRARPFLAPAVDEVNKSLGAEIAKIIP
jgi:HK97 gp10 family phage protein